MKKFNILILMMLLPLVASAGDSGSCGDNLTYTYVESKHTLTISGTGSMTDYYWGNHSPWYDYRKEIASVILESGVTSIGNFAFYECWRLTSVTIPGSVTSVGEHAFFECGSLTSITIPDSVTSIGKWAFGFCGLTSITIPNSVTSIGQSAFQNCSLTSVTIPNSVTSIGEQAFVNCRCLTSITIPNSVTSIGNEAFRGCGGLTSIHVEEGNSKYDSRYNCNAIIETSSNTLIAGCINSTIPNSVTIIGADAFCGCTGLTSITIPGSVTSIGRYAFAACISLTDVTCLGETVPNTDSNAYTDSNIENTTLHVPGTAIDAYKTRAPWKNFKEIVALTDQELSVKGVMSDNKCETTSYNLGGLRTDTTYKGLQVVRKSDGTMKKVVRK